MDNLSRHYLAEFVKRNEERRASFCSSCTYRTSEASIAEKRKGFNAINLNDLNNELDNKENDSQASYQLNSAQLTSRNSVSHYSPSPLGKAEGDKTPLENKDDEFREEKSKNNFSNYYDEPNSQRHLNDELSHHDFSLDQDNNQNDIVSRPSFPLKKQKTRANEAFLDLLKNQSRKATKIRDFVKIDSFLIYPDDSFKGIWNVIIALFLLFTAIVTPFRIAFVDIDSTEWVVVDSFVDALFGIDIILNFYTVYWDEDDNLVTDKRKITKKYIKTWFIIDFIAIIPISLILNYSKDYTSLARIARLPRLYRLLKMTKLTRIIKIAKERNKLVAFINDLLKLKVGIERLVYFALLLAIVCHITACLWYLLAKIDNLSPETWVIRYSFQDKSNTEVYIAAYYWALTIITTMGDAGIRAETSWERLLSIIIMILGICAYSFAVGSLTSLLTALDSKEAKLREKLNVVEDLRAEYNINYDTYIKLRKAVKYDHSRNISEKFNFVQQLPHSLNIELSYIMHQEMIKKIPFFQKLTHYEIAFIAPLLRPLKVLEGEYIFKEGDGIDDMFFLVNGKADFVIPNINGDLSYINISEGCYFGDMDIIDIGGEKRLFTVKAMSDCELLAIQKQNLHKIDIELEHVVEKLLEKSNSKLESALKLKERAAQYLQDESPTLQEVNESDPNLSNTGKLNMVKRGSKFQQTTLSEIGLLNKFSESSEKEASVESSPPNSIIQEEDDSYLESNQTNTVPKQSSNKTVDDELQKKSSDENESKNHLQEISKMRRSSNWDLIKNKLTTAISTERLLNPIQAIRLNHQIRIPKKCTSLSPKKPRKRVTTKNLTDKEMIDTASGKSKFFAKKHSISSERVHELGLFHQPHSDSGKNIDSKTKKPKSVKDEPPSLPLPFNDYFSRENSKTSTLTQTSRSKLPPIWKLKNNEEE